jgi:Fur family ferric uptake transcriptional regulator
MNKPIETLEEQCTRKGMRMTDQRRTIAQVMEQAADHPDVEELYRRASAIDARISLSTVYRTLNLFEEAGLVTKHDFRDGRARFEPIPDEHHDHLIDIRSGKVIEFRNEEIEAIQEIIAKRLGYRLVDHRLELYAVPLAKSDSKPEVRK